GACARGPVGRDGAGFGEVSDEVEVAFAGFVGAIDGQEIAARPALDPDEAEDGPLDLSVVEVGAGTVHEPARAGAQYDACLFIAVRVEACVVSLQAEIRPVAAVEDARLRLPASGQQEGQSRGHERASHRIPPCLRENLSPPGRYASFALPRLPS